MRPIDDPPTEEDHAFARTAFAAGFTQTSRKYRQLTCYDTTDPRNWKPLEVVQLTPGQFAAFRELCAGCPVDPNIAKMKNDRLPKAKKLLELLRHCSDEEALDALQDVLIGHADVAISRYMHRTGQWPIPANPDDEPAAGHDRKEME